MPTRTRPAVTPERHRGRGVATLLAGLGLGLTVFMGTTMASFADLEYGRETVSVGTHNLLIATTAGFCNTSADGLPDNKPETDLCGSLAPLKFPAPAAPIVPGDPATAAAFTFQVKADLGPGPFRTNLGLQVVDDPNPDEPAADANGLLAAALRFDVSVTRGSTTAVIASGVTLAGLADGLVLNGPGAATGFETSAADGEVFTVTVTASVPDQGSRLANAALDQRTYNLLVIVTATACTEGRDGCVV
jgi:hypothetical protein